MTASCVQCPPELSNCDHSQLELDKRGRPAGRRHLPEAYFVDQVDRKERC